MYKLSQSDSDKQEPEQTSADDILKDIISLDNSVDELLVERSDAVPLRKTDIYNVRILTSRQLNILYHLTQKATPYIPIYTYESNNIIDTRIAMYSTASNDFIYNDISKYKSTGNYVKDLYNEVYKIINGQRSILLHGIFRASEATYIAEQISANSGSKELFQETSSLLTRVNNGCYGYVPSCLNDIARWNIISEEYSFGLAIKVLYTSCSSYNKTCSIAYNGPVVKAIHRIVLIPRDLQAKLLRPRKYFEEIRTILKYNELTGFYEYIIQSLAIPVICKHEYMTYDNQPMSEVAFQCYRDGKCKYCGQELIAYHEQIHETVSPKIYEIIFKFLNSIAHSIDITALLYSLFNLVFDVIKQVLGNINNSNYVSTMFAFVCLYLYNIYINSTDNPSATTINVKEENRISYNSRIAVFLDTSKKYWSNIGWSMKSISNIIQQTDVLKNVDIPINIIKSYIVKNLTDYLELFPLSVLFHKTVYPSDISGLIATTDMQKLWLSGNDKMREFNAMIDRLYLSIWKYTNVKYIINNMASRNIITSHRDTVFNQTKQSASHFYDIVFKIYCPVYFIHSFTAGVCKYCGLKENGSNKQDIYNTYIEQINDVYLQSPNIIPKDRFFIEPLYTEASVKKYKAEELFEKYILIDNHLDRTKLDAALSKDAHLEELLHTIANILHLNLNREHHTTQFARSCLCFIIDTKIMSRESVILELYNIYFPFPNISYII